VVTRDNSLWFCKINDAGRFPDLFTREGQGLELLGGQGLIRVPAVIACEEVDGTQVLVLEWIKEGERTPGFWTRFGEQLADLHHNTNNFQSASPGGPASNSHSSTGLSTVPPSSDRFSSDGPSSPGDTLVPHLYPSDRPYPGDFPYTRPSGRHFDPPPFPLPPDHPFGLGHNNYIGSLPQSNTPSADWTSFFINQRLQPQLKLSVDQGLLDPSAVRKFEALYQVLPEIFAEDRSSQPFGHPPGLLHGDLWSGNILCDENSQPVLIDPAVYYGHPGMDLAMTTLFGGFGPGFYEAYNHHYPFSANYRQQWEICNLYPLLVHLNLFGVVSGKGAGPKDSPFSESIDVGPSVSSSVTTFSYLGNILRTIQRF
jgi:fructosamine-3-kinase